MMTAKPKLATFIVLALGTLLAAPAQAQTTTLPKTPVPDKPVPTAKPAAPPRRNGHRQTLPIGPTRNDRRANTNRSGSRRVQCPTFRTNCAGHRRRSWSQGKCRHHSCHYVALHHLCPSGSRPDSDFLCHLLAKRLGRCTGWSLHHPDARLGDLDKRVQLRREVVHLRSRIHPIACLGQL